MFDSIYLHIGLDKTGSKAIQFSCFENTETLNKASIFYPITPDTVWHAEFASFFHENPKHYDYNQAIGRSQKELSIIQSEDINYLRNLEQKIQQTDAKTMVLSYEGFAFLETETLKKMQHYLAGLSKQIKIILYCRNPISYAVSAVSQRAISMSPLWDNVPIQLYKNICEKFSIIFGVENMIVRNFSKDYLCQGDVRADFFKQIGFDFTKAAKFKLSASGENRSLCAEAIFIAESLKKYCQQEQISEAEFSWRYTPILQKIKGSPYLLSTEQLTQVILKSQEHRDYLHETFSINFNDSENIDTVKNDLILSSNFIDSIAEIISIPHEFTPPLIPEVKTEKELACNPFLGKLNCLEAISSLVVGQKTDLAVEIFNNSDFNWLFHGLNPTYLSYHWQKESGEMVVFEGLRSPFSELSLHYQQSLITKIHLIAPLEIGVYHLILTLVKENICWFEDNGFTTTKISITVV